MECSLDGKQFSHNLQRLGVENLCYEGAEDVLDTLSLLFFLARLNTLPNQHSFLQALSAGVVTPSWVSESLHPVYVQAKEKGEAMFRKIVPVALAVTRRATIKYQRAPLQLLTFPGSCLFDVMEAGADGANNAVVEACVYGDTVEEASHKFFTPHIPKDLERPWSQLQIHTVAVKILSKKNILSKGKAAKARCIEEIYIARKVSHAAIIRTFHSCEAFDLLFLIMEYANRGDLVNAIRESGAFSEPQARHMFTQIVSGLTYLHKMFIIHRDIKPENVLLHSLSEDSSDSSILKCQALLADFGAAVDISKNNRTVLHGTVGTLAYAAPEILLGMPYKPEPVDIWSLGVMLFAMVFGRLPWSFENKTIEEAYAMLTKQPYSIPTEHQIHGPVSPQCRDLIAHLIRVNPVIRFTLKQIWNHPWMLCKPTLTRCLLPRLNLHYRSEEKTNYRNSHVVMTTRKNRFSLLMKNNKEFPLARSFSICQATTMSSGGWSHESFSKQCNVSPRTNAVAHLPMNDKDLKDSFHSCENSVDDSQGRSIFGNDDERSYESTKHKKITVTKAAQAAAQYLATAAIDFIGSLRSSRRPASTEVMDLEQQNLTPQHFETNPQQTCHPFNIQTSSDRTAWPPQSFRYTPNDVSNANVCPRIGPEIQNCRCVKVPPLDFSLYHSRMSSVNQRTENFRLICTQRDRVSIFPNVVFQEKRSAGWRTERSHPYSFDNPSQKGLPLVCSARYRRTPQVHHNYTFACPSYVERMTHHA